MGLLGDVSVVIAALYVEKDGAYYGLDGVDPWDEGRDARLYDGPWAVVAHPPCNRWVSYGARELRGKDGGCFDAALRAVRRFGGVLEHPARSQAWRSFALPIPTGNHWTRSMLDARAWVCEIDQYLYGFPTRKNTWLYFVGPEPQPVSVLRSTAKRGCETLWSTQRSKTPELFRDVLLALAGSVRQAEHDKAIA